MEKFKMSKFAEEALDRLVYHAIYHGDDAENWSPCQDGQTIQYELDKYKWQPIEGAPKDQHLLLAHCVFQYTTVDVGYWNKSKSCFIDIKTGVKITPYYYMLLPRHPDEGR
jgi:hypothetical protein